MMRSPSAVSTGAWRCSSLRCCVRCACFVSCLLFAHGHSYELEKLRSSMLDRPCAGEQSLDICGRHADTSLPVLRRVQGFPTIKAFVNGRMLDYSGDRSAGHLKDWAISLIPQKVRARLTTGPEVGVVLLFHSSGRGMYAGMQTFLCNCAGDCTEPGQQAGGFPAALRGGLWEGEEGRQVWREPMKHSWSS